MTIDRLDRIEEELETVTTLLTATARHAESAHKSFDQLSRKLDEYVFQSQRLITGHEERLVGVQGNTERLEAVFAMQQRQMESLEQNHRLLQQLVTTQQEQLNRQQQQLERMDETQRTTNAALEQLGSILNQLLKRD